MADQCAPVIYPRTVLSLASSVDGNERQPGQQIGTTVRVKSTVRANRLRPPCPGFSPGGMSKIPFRYFKTSPEIIRLASYRAAMEVIGNERRQEVARHLNNRAENSHLPIRRSERAMSRFRRMSNLQKFATTHASFHNHFNLDRHINHGSKFKSMRNAALSEWRGLLAG